jgi:hypothetical protein
MPNKNCIEVNCSNDCNTCDKFAIKVTYPAASEIPKSKGIKEKLGKFRSKVEFVKFLIEWTMLTIAIVQKIIDMRKQAEDIRSKW